MALKRGFQDLGFDEMCGSPAVQMRVAPFRADVSDRRADVSGTREEDGVHSSAMVSQSLDPHASTPVHALDPLSSEDDGVHSSVMVSQSLDPHASVHALAPHSSDSQAKESHSSALHAPAAHPHATVEINIPDIRADVTATIADDLEETGGVQNSVPSDKACRSVWDRLEPKIVKGDVEKQSFAAIVGGVPEPELEFFPIKEESDKRVHIPVNLMKGMVKTYRTVLLGYFLGPRVPYHVVLRTVTKAWGKFGFIDAMVNMHGFFFFRFNDEGGCRHVVDSSPLLINGVPLFVTQWDPSKGLAKPVHTMCPLWVKLYNIPLVAFNREGISRIASAIGIPLRMDACTASTCDKLWGRTSFAKLLVNVWAKGELKREVEVVIPKLSGEEEDVVTVIVEYDWEPSQCSICKVFGHTDMVCGKRVIRNEIAINERRNQTQKEDAEGFQMPRRRQWKPKLSNSKEDKEGVESSNTKKGNLETTGDTLVGVGTVKRAMKPNGKEGGERQNKLQDVVGGYCTIHAGRTPGNKEGVVIEKEGLNMNKQKGTAIEKGSKEAINKVVQTQEPLLKSVVETFKKYERAKRGNPLVTSNSFDVLSSDESDEESVEDVDTGERKLEEPGSAVNISK